MARERRQGIEEVTIMIAFSAYPHRKKETPPDTPRFVMLGMDSSLVVLIMEATIALMGYVSIVEKDMTSADGPDAE
jgi:hypothetical protein